MVQDDKSGTKKFGLGLLLGTVIGGITAFFLSPASGEENRKMAAEKLRELRDNLEEADIPGKIREIYGEATEQGEKMFKQVRRELLSRMDEVKDQVGEFDLEKYKTIVAEVVERVREEMNETNERAEKLKEFFVDEWEKVGKQTKKTVRKVAKKK